MSFRMAAPMMTMGGFASGVEAHRGPRGSWDSSAARRRRESRAPCGGGRAQSSRGASAAAQGARLDDARHEAGKRGGLPGTGIRLVEELGDEDRGRRLADAGNGGQQVALRAQARVLIEMLANQMLDVGDLRVEVGEDGFDRGADLGDPDAGGEAISFCVRMPVQRVEAPHERL